MRQFLLGLSFSVVFMVGCAVGTMQGIQVAGAQMDEAPAPEGGMPLEVRCFGYGVKSDAAAAEGWEPFAVMKNSVCFKRPLP